MKLEAGGKKGSVLVEVVVGAALTALLAGGTLLLFNNFLRLAGVNLHRVQAVFLAEEGAEVLRLWRDKNWSLVANLVPGSDYYFVFAGGAWATSTTPTVDDLLFTRKFRVAEVYRDAAQDIAPSGALDPNTKKLSLSVSWEGGAGIENEFYLANLFGD